MLEHLDDPLQPPNSAIDPEFEDVRQRAAQRRRTQGAVAGVVVFSVLVTGGVSGLALGGPDVVHAPITDIGPNQVCVAWESSRRSTLITEFVALAVAHLGSADA